ncbi:MAG: hypothetical protein J6A23_15165 [Thermoguttaceae bacterium]|nr:hypothetical protein [Thermoguttaceae bacterium]
MLKFYIFLQCLRRALWLIPLGLLVGFAPVIDRVISTPALDAVEEFLLGPRLPVSPLLVWVFPPLFYVFGIACYARKFFLLLSQKGFESRVVKDDHWKNSIMPQIQKEIEAGELVFPSGEAFWIMPPQEYQTRMYIAGFYWKDPELRASQPKLHDSLFHM